MNIKILDHNTQKYLFSGEIPKIPRKKEAIGFYIDAGGKQTYIVRKVIEVLYEFDMFNKFDHVELIVKD